MDILTTSEKETKNKTPKKITGGHAHIIKNDNYDVATISFNDGELENTIHMCTEDKTVYIRLISKSIRENSAFMDGGIDINYSIKIEEMNVEMIKSITWNSIKLKLRKTTVEAKGDDLTRVRRMTESMSNPNWIWINQKKYTEKETKNAKKIIWSTELFKKTINKIILEFKVEK